MESVSDYFRLMTALFVIMNPFGAVPIFLSMTSGHDPKRRNRTALTASCTVAVVMAGSAVAGEWTLRMFGINLPSFQVGGGILVLLMAISMLNARPGRTRHAPEEAREAEEMDTMGVVPLGTPLLAGPGTMSTAIIFANKTSTLWQMGLLCASCCVVAAGVWIVLRLAEPIGMALGRTGINILTRLMGLILTAMAVKFITDGLAVLLPGLTGGAVQ